MRTIQTRFGDVEYHPESVLQFPAGLIGFRDLHNFIVMPNEKQGPLFWIQSIGDPEVAFVLTDPTNFSPSTGLNPTVTNGRNSACARATKPMCCRWLPSIPSARSP